jgi:hypothetical protein
VDSLLVVKVRKIDLDNKFNPAQNKSTIFQSLKERFAIYLEQKPYTSKYGKVDSNGWKQEK